MGLASNEGLGVDAQSAMDMLDQRKEGTESLNAGRRAAEKLDCACGGDWRQVPKREFGASASPALPKRAIGGGGEADHELNARRSTAARSANQKHLSMLPERPKLLVPATGAPYCSCCEPVGRIAERGVCSRPAGFAASTQGSGWNPCACVPWRRTTAIGTSAPGDATARDVRD